MNPRSVKSELVLTLRYLTEAEEPVSVLDLAAHLKINRKNAQAYLVILIERKQARIAAYRRNHNGRPTPLYELIREGQPSHPAPALPPLTQEERLAKRVNRYAVANAKRRAQRAADRGKTISPFTKHLQLAGLL